MAGQQKLSAERLKKLENRIDDVISSMNGQVKDLENVVHMLETQWRGVGGGQFKKAQHDINMYHRNLQKLMGMVQDAVGATRTSGGANDAEVASSMKGMGDLNGGGAGNGQVGAGYSSGGDFAQYSKLSGL